MTILDKNGKLRFTRILRPLRFGVVGASGVAVNTLVLWLLARVGSTPVLAASAIATEVAVLTNFVLNDRWTFRDARHSSVFGRLLRFNGVALGGMLITVGVLALLTNTTALPLLVANLVAVAGAMVWNYVVNSRWTWKPPVANEHATPHGIRHEGHNL